MPDEHDPPSEHGCTEESESHEDEGHSDTLIGDPPQGHPDGNGEYRNDGSSHQGCWGAVPNAQGQPAEGQTGHEGPGGGGHAGEGHAPGMDGPTDADEEQDCGQIQDPQGTTHEGPNGSASPPQVARKRLCGVLAQRSWAAGRKSGIHRRMKASNIGTVNSISPHRGE